MTQATLHGAVYPTLQTVITVLLCLAAFDDYKTRHVRDVLTNSIVVVGALYVVMSLVSVPFAPPLSNVAGAVVFALPMLISALAKEQSVGGADIRIVFGVGLLVGFAAMVRIFVVSAVTAIMFAVIYSVVKRSKLTASVSLPYVPFLLLGAAVEWALFLSV